jgi:hypothetical protein
MYWRYRLNKKHGFALKDETEDQNLDSNMIKGPLEDFFVVKTDVKFEKLKLDIVEADKVLCFYKETIGRGRVVQHEYAP